MQLETLVRKLEAVLGANLNSVILYGSAAAGDHSGRRSDYNVLVVAGTLGSDVLAALAPVARAWKRAGNPPPLLFTRERLQRSADVFPIELLDMRDCHRVLHGEDVLATVEVSRENLRLEIEHELKGKIIQLREGYLLAAGSRRRVRRLLVGVLSTFEVLFRAALRLYGPDVPAVKQEAVRRLAAHVPFDVEVFAALDAIKRGTGGGADGPDALFSRLLAAAEAVADAVDRGGA